jgi:methionyl-tRNA formyltransferase
MSERPPFVFFGSPPIGPIALRVLELNNYQPAAVITDTSLSSEAMVNIILEARATFILVVGYGAILKQAVLDSVAGQALNIHPSLLPLYRGPAPVVQTILDGPPTTGVTLMEIDSKMDHGPIVAQEEYPLTGRETPAELYEVLTQLGTRLFLDTIDGYLNETVPLYPQNHFEATVTHFIKKEDGLLDLGEEAELNERKVRAYQGWPGTWVMYRGKRLIIHEAHVEGGTLLLDQVQPENGKRMSFTAFCSGARATADEVLRELSSS